jgi:transcriptional regulator with XRE-family HTH domain
MGQRPLNSAFQLSPGAVLQLSYIWYNKASAASFSASLHLSFPDPLKTCRFRQVFSSFSFSPISSECACAFGCCRSGTRTMTNGVKTYLRTFRRRSGLTQAELAFLLGADDGAQVSRYERLSRRPSFQTALGLQAVFGVPAETLLPVVSAEVERKIISRAHLLSRRLERHSDSARTKRKIRFLTSITARGRIAPQHL